MKKRIVITCGLLVAALFAGVGLKSINVSAEKGEREVLYEIKTSAGSNMGMVPIVAGNAVVFLSNNNGVRQGDYVPEESDALKAKLEEIMNYALSEKEVAEWALYKEKQLRRFSWPDGVETVGKFAFARSGLEKVDIPEGVTTIGKGAFYHCDNLKEVVIPDSVTDIGENAFSHTPWLDGWIANEAGEPGDFLIVGDGILLAYRGKEEKPAIPNTVKKIVPGAVK